MTKVVSVTLDPQLNEFVDAQVSGGFYSSTTEVVDAALRLLQHQAELEAIRAAIEEGEQSGEPQSLDFEALSKGSVPPGNCDEAVDLFAESGG